MAQITEDYVSFETAKLLKEKGFDWEDSPFYSEQDRDDWRRNNSYTVPNEEYNPELPFDSETLTLVAPHISLQMAMKWLREVHKIHIATYPTSQIELVVGKGFVRQYSCDIFNDNEFVQSLGIVTGYEQACEAAIKYCLENLI